MAWKVEPQKEQKRGTKGLVFLTIKGIKEGSIKDIKVSYSSLGEKVTIGTKKEIKLLGLTAEN